MSDVTPGQAAAGCAAVLIGVVGLLVVFSILGTIPVYFIWNKVLIDVVPVLKPVTFIQAWAISVFIGLFRSSTTVNKSD